MSIRECHRGQPWPIAATVSAHVEQKRECPQGTKATPDHGTRWQTSQQSATSGDDDVNAAVAAASVRKGGLRTSSSSSSSVLEELSWRDGVCAPRLWLTVLRNWRWSYAPESNLWILCASLIQQIWLFLRSCMLRPLFARATPIM